MKLVREKSVLFLGKSQVGKSHLCNVLCARPTLFKEGNKIASCTLKPEKETIHLYDDEEHIAYHITLNDTPGLFDTRTKEDNDTLMGRIMDFIKYEINSLDRIFYVMKLGAVSPEEIKCIELIRSLFSEDALKSGIFTLILTNCDLMDMSEREVAVEALKESGLKPYLRMFAPNDESVQVIAVDFSKHSQTVESDRQEVLKSILTAGTGMHKTVALRFYATMQEAMEKKKMRDALVANIMAELKTPKSGESKTICPMQ